MRNRLLLRRLPLRHLPTKTELDVVAAETVPPHPILELGEKSYCSGANAWQES